MTPKFRGNTQKMLECTCVLRTAKLKTGNTDCLNKHLTAQWHSELLVHSYVESSSDLCMQISVSMNIMPCKFV
jgi:hypothetical protein